MTHFEKLLFCSGGNLEAFVEGHFFQGTSFFAFI